MVSDFQLAFRQQPKQSRMCGVGEKGNIKRPRASEKEKERGGGGLYYLHFICVHSTYGIGWVGGREIYIHTHPWITYLSRSPSNS